VSAVDAFIAVGSNIAPERNVEAALELLMQHVRVVASSTFYRTAPLDRSEQASFLNGVWRVATLMTPRALKFDVLRQIEAELGRVRMADKYAPRTIDLDLVLYGDAVVDESDLRLPDPDIRTRPFIAAPLLELAPDLRLPDTGEALAVLPCARVAPDMEPDEALTARLRERIDLHVAAANDM